MKKILVVLMASLLLVGCFSSKSKPKQTQRPPSNLGDNRICTFTIEQIATVTVKMKDGSEYKISEWKAPASVLYVADNVGICYLMGISYDNTMEGSK